MTIGIRSVITISLLAIFASYIQAQTLTDYNWKNRIIVLCGDSSHDLYQEQLSLLSVENLISAWQERKILIIESSSLTEHSNPCPHDGPFAIKLYGLDGRLKMTNDQIVDPQAIIDLIDIMPMRMAELQRKGW